MIKLPYFFLLWCMFNNTACNSSGSYDNSNIPITDSVITTTLTKDSFETQKIYDNVVCKTDASQSYALYLPLQYHHENLPVIYFFDPHADGTLPLKKYKALADEYNLILIGSNTSKNGNDWPTTENIWNNLFSDTRNRIQFNAKRIYTCGFSGGAKVASYIALHHPEIKSVIAGGAGLPDDVPAGNFNFAFTGITGKGDMNMTDIVQLNSELDKTSTRHHLILFNGKHEWSPEPTMKIAFESIVLDAMHNQLVPKNDSLINAYVSESKKRLYDNIKANDLLQANNECRLSISMLDSLTNDANWFKEKDASIINSSSYKQQLQQQQNLFNVEQSKKAEYQQQFQNGDINYWTSTIADLQTKAKAQIAGGAMYQRLLAYLSLAFYSISNNLINNNQNQPAQYFVTLYKLADSTNSEAWYFSAILNARSNNAHAAKDDLLKAISYGLNDAKRMMQQPEFQSLSTQINFSELESKMKH